MTYKRGGRMFTAVSKQYFIYKSETSEIVRLRHKSRSLSSPHPPFPFFSLIILLPSKFLTRRLVGNKVPAFRADAKLVSALLRVVVSVAQLAFLWWTPL